MEICYHFEIGKAYEYTNMGCSPEQLGKLCGFLRQIKGKASSIYVAMYLFNNMEFYKVLKELSEAGCEVTIYSIPLEGYDNDMPCTIKNHISEAPVGRWTKYGLAKEIYEEISGGDHDHIHLRIVPHMYLRSSRVKKFSRGNMPYSLHCKTMCVQCIDGTMYAGLTSSNMAVRDAQKIELGLMSSLNHEQKGSTLDFYSGLYENSIDVKEFDAQKDYSHYRIVKRAIPAETTLMYTAPFYEDSAGRFEEIISSMVCRAGRRIIVCAQHICSYRYTYENKYVNGEAGEISKKGFLSDVLDRAKSGVPTCFLSQTYVDEGGSHGCRRPRNENGFRAFVSAAREGNCQYYVNNNIHSKFMVIDDIVLITTCNFTPTQFIYLPNVTISAFDQMPGYSYSGIHCEFGVYSIIKNHDFAERIVAEFEEILKMEDTKKMFDGSGSLN